MSTKVLSQQEIYQKYKDEVLALAPEFTDFSPGSIHDIIAGALSIAMNEVSELVVSEFAKTFFDLAEGSDLDKLAVDHFGSTFARTQAVKATGPVTFSRANTNAGDVTIPAGTIVKTIKNSAGEEIRFLTDEEATLTGLLIAVNVTAENGGSAGNAGIGKISVLEGALSDPSITVSNLVVMAGGKEALTDAEYREFIKAKILSLAGATEAAVKGAAEAVPGVGYVALTTQERVVIDYDIATEDIAASAEFFRIPYPVLYIADESGNSSQALIEAVEAAVHQVKAAGVKVIVKGAVGIPMNWTASLTLNISGPNYSELQSDLTKIKETMKQYIDEQLAIGSDFVRSAANAYIMSVWGPAGTNDLTAFTTSVPVGDVAAAPNEKIISGTMSII